MTREPTYAALFAFWQGLVDASGTPLFRSATRNAKTWDGYQAEEQPALLQMQRREQAQYKKGLPTIWKLDVNLLIYVNTNAVLAMPTVTPSAIINPLIDAIEGALVVDDPFNNACTLGGLVSHCAIEGSIEIYEGTLGDEAVVLIPIGILTSP